MKYSRELKKELCEKICVNGDPTLKTANEYNIPIKTLEKWITAYHKDLHCFDHKIESVNDFSIITKSENSNYDNLNIDDLKKIIL